MNGLTQPQVDPAEVEPSVGLLHRVIERPARTAAALLLIAGSIIGVKGNEASADTNDYPYRDAPCLAGNPNDPNSSYGKTTGTGQWCEGGRWGDPNTGVINDESGYGIRHSTSFARHMSESINRVRIPMGLGAPNQWDDRAPSHWQVDTTPAVGDIAVSETGISGRLGVVKEVLPDGSIGVGAGDLYGDGNYTFTYHQKNAQGVYNIVGEYNWDKFVTPIAAADGSSTITTTTTTQPNSAPQPGSSSNGSSEDVGYIMLSGGGGVYAFGNARHLGGPGEAGGNTVDIAVKPNSSGSYWIVNEAGDVFGYGLAKPIGERPVLAAGEKVVSLSSTPSGEGYWLFTDLGRVIARGDAKHFGDMSGVRLAGKFLDSVATPTGKGYYAVAEDGGVFSFGDAKFYGSMGGKRLNGPVLSLVTDPDGVGYWLVASDGGVFAFSAGFRGSMGGKHLNKPIFGMVAYGNGYLMGAEDGGVFNFSDKPFSGSLANRLRLTKPIVSIAAVD